MDKTDVKGWMEIPVCFQNSCAGVLEMFEQINGSIFGKLFPFLFTFSLKGAKSHYKAIAAFKCRESEAHKKKINWDYIAEERKALQPLRQQSYSLHEVFYDQNPKEAFEECRQNTAA